MVQPKPQLKVVRMMQPKAIVICLDDEPHVLSSLTRTLRGEPYELRVTEDIEQAIAWAKNEPIAVFISDYRMEAKTGIQVLEEVRNVCPGASRVILSGFADESMMDEAIQTETVNWYLLKPWAPHDLRAFVNGLVAEWLMKKGQGGSHVGV